VDVLYWRDDIDPDVILFSPSPAFGLFFAQDDSQMRTPMPAPTPQPGPPRPELGRWWKNSDVVSALGLTAAQVNQIEQAFLDHRLKLIDLRADVERQEAKLQPLIEADQPDETKVSAQLDLLLAARGRLEKANAMMMLGIRKVLSVEQWKKLEAIQQQREGPWERRGPDGGPMMRRPGDDGPGFNAPQARPARRPPPESN
jgi:Spy/CpxP family protein refolding chaperone